MLGNKFQLRDLVWGLRLCISQVISTSLSCRLFVEKFVAMLNWTFCCTNQFYSTLSNLKIHHILKNITSVGWGLIAHRLFYTMRSACFLSEHLDFNLTSIPEWPPAKLQSSWKITFLIYKMGIIIKESTTTQAVCPPFNVIFHTVKY